MQDILNNFGINWFLLAAQIVNFLIVIWLLKKFAYKPIFSMLEKRRKQIEQGLKDAEKSQQLLEKTQQEEKEVLKKAQATAQDILSDAQKQAQETLKVAEEGAKVRVAKMLEDGKKEIEQEVVEAERTLSQHTAQLAVQLLEKSLPDMLDAQTQREVVEKLTKKLTK